MHWCVERAFTSFLVMGNESWNACMEGKDLVQINNNLFSLVCLAFCTNKLILRCVDTRINIIVFCFLSEIILHKICFLGKYLVDSAKTSLIFLNKKGPIVQG